MVKGPSCSPLRCLVRIPQECLFTSWVKSTGRHCERVLGRYDVLLIQNGRIKLFPRLNMALLASRSLMSIQFLNGLTSTHISPISWWERHLSASSHPRQLYRVKLLLPTMGRRRIKGSTFWSRSTHSGFNWLMGMTRTGTPILRPAA